ncbi:unnamed protein product [Mucor hiemalis]
MGNTCCSGESLSNDERKELEELREKRYEYPQKVQEERSGGPSPQQPVKHQGMETTVHTYKANEVPVAREEGHQLETAATANEARTSVSEEGDYGKQIQNAMWPPVNQQAVKDDQTQIQNKILPPPPPLLSNTIGNDGFNDTIGHNIWPTPPPLESYTDRNNTLNDTVERNTWPPSSLANSQSGSVVHNILPPPPTDNHNDHFTHNVWPPPPPAESESITHDVWPPTSSTPVYENKIPTPLNHNEDDDIFTNNVWPPPANHGATANINTEQTADIQQNIWPPPLSDTMPSAQTYTNVSSQYRTNENIHYDSPNTKDTTTDPQSKPEKPHSKNENGR